MYIGNIFDPEEDYTIKEISNRLAAYNVCDKTTFISPMKEVNNGKLKSDK